MRRSVLLGGLSALAFASSAQAQSTAGTPGDEANGGGLEEIIVTAQKREQNLQDVAVAVSAITSEAIVTKGITQFENLVTASPGLTITQGTIPTASSINLRGIGTSAFSISVEPSVAVVVDDVAVLQQAQAFANLVDIERIEVLRGPQGTLFGKNASAGAINIVTKGPTDTLTGRVAATVTTDEEYRIEAGLSGPLGENAGFRINAFYGDREGYVRNLATGTKQGANESWGVRGKISLEPTDNLTVSISADHSVSEGNGSPRTLRTVSPTATIFGTPIASSLIGLTPSRDNLQVRQNIDTYTRSEQSTVSGRAALELGAVDLISITSYQTWNFKFVEDFDAIAAPIFGNANGLVQSSPFNSKYFAQEFRLVSSSPSSFQYLLGLFYANGRTKRTFERGPSGPLTANWAADAGTKTYAAFAQATYDLTERTHVDAGLRFNRETIDVSFQRRNRPAVAPANNAVCLDTCFGVGADNQVTGKIALRQDLSDGVMAYASFSTGYKGQGFDVSTGFTPARAANPVKPETSRSYEIGFKSRFLDNKVQLNVTAFLVDYDNFQAQSVVVMPDLSAQFQLNNVGKLRTKGVELELQARPTSTLSFDFGAAYTDAVVTSFPQANCYTGQTAAQGCFDVDGAGPGTLTAQNLAGKRLANSPKFKFNVSATYDILLESLPFNAFVNLDYRYQTAVNFDLAQNPLFVEPAFGILNGSVGIKESGTGAYRLSLFAVNLFDKQYASNVGGVVGGPPTAVNQVVSRDARRYFGIRGSYNF